MNVILWKLTIFKLFGNSEQVDLIICILPKIIFEENELDKSLVMRKFGNSDFSIKLTNFYMVLR